MPPVPRFVTRRVYIDSNNATQVNGQQSIVYPLNEPIKGAVGCNVVDVNIPRSIVNLPNASPFAFFDCVGNLQTVVIPTGAYNGPDLARMVGGALGNYTGATTSSMPQGYGCTYVEGSNSFIFQAGAPWQGIVPNNSSTPLMDLIGFPTYTISGARLTHISSVPATVGLYPRYLTVSSVALSQSNNCVSNIGSSPLQSNLIAIVDIDGNSMDTSYRYRGDTSRGEFPHISLNPLHSLKYLDFSISDDQSKSTALTKPWTMILEFIIDQEIADSL